MGSEAEDGESGGRTFEPLQFGEFFRGGEAAASSATQLDPALQSRRPLFGSGRALGFLLGALGFLLGALGFLFVAKVGGLAESLFFLSLNCQLLETQEPLSRGLIDHHFRSRQIEADAQPWTDETLHGPNPPQHFAAP